MRQAAKLTLPGITDWLILALMSSVTGFVMVLTHPDVGQYAPIHLPSAVIMIQLFWQGYVAANADLDATRIFMLLTCMNSLSIFVFLVNMALALYVTYGRLDPDMLLSWVTQALLAHVVLMITVGSLGALSGLGLRAYRYRV